MKNRMREIRTSGSVRGEEGNLLAYSTCPVPAGAPEGEMCKTNPIYAGIGFQGSGVSQLTPDPRPLTPGASQPIVQNEANLASGDGA